MNEAFPTPTQLSANGIWFEKCNCIIQINTCITLLFLVCHRCCKNADSILLGFKFHLALGLTLCTNPPACATCLPGQPLSEYLAYLLFPTQHCDSQRTQNEAKGFLRSCLKSGWFSVKLRNCEEKCQSLWHSSSPLLSGCGASSSSPQATHWPSWKLKRAQYKDYKNGQTLPCWV